MVAPEAHLFCITARLPNKLILGARISLVQPVLKNRLDRKTEALLTLNQLITKSLSSNSTKPKQHETESQDLRKIKGDLV